MDPSQFVESAIKLALALVPVIALVLARRRLGEPNAASWLFAYGAVILLGEDAGWTIGYALGVVSSEAVIWTGHAEDVRLAVELPVAL